tara:strand:+ start:328 stop:648 length:321 start_codon:yes stop_codon:yes gene_type:complete
MPTQLAYLAGVFDGEGSFGMWSKGKNKCREFRASIEMCDGDVILKFLSYFKIGSVTIRVPTNEKHKVTYHWRANHDKGKEVVREMLPFLSKRRQAKFHEILSGLDK